MAANLALTKQAIMTIFSAVDPKLQPAVTLKIPTEDARVNAQLSSLLRPSAVEIDIAA